MLVGYQFTFLFSIHFVLRFLLVSLSCGCIFYHTLRTRNTIHIYVCAFGRKKNPENKLVDRKVHTIYEYVIILEETERKKFKKLDEKRTPNRNREEKTITMDHPHSHHRRVCAMQTSCITMKRKKGTREQKLT